MTMISGILPKRCLIDTNVLLRLSKTREEAPAQHRSVQMLLDNGTRLYTTFQNIAEFWNVSTRPRIQNGNGLTPEQANIQLNLLRPRFEIVTEDCETFNLWLQLIVDFNVSGRQVHDARLAAHMLVRNIPTLLTSNTKDFLRYPQIQLLDPERMA
jgi:predicted nucleic acid-binding protein